MDSVLWDVKEENLTETKKQGSGQGRIPRGSAAWAGMQNAFRKFSGLEVHEI